MPRSMSLAIGLVVALAVSACGGSAAPSPTATASAAAAPPVSLKINWTAVSGASSGLWTAYEAGYFKEEGITAELVNISSSSPAVAALLSKEIHFSHLDGQVTADANLGGANLKLIYGINNRLVFSVMVKPDIKRPEDLKGKRLGITTIGSSTHTAGLLALRMWNLQEKDVTFIALKDVPSILVGLQNGSVDAGVVSPPTNTRAKVAGFSELLNLAKDGPEWTSVALGTTAEYLAANPTVGVRVVRAYARGVQRFKSDKAFAMTVLKKYLQLNDEAVLEDTRSQYSQYLAETPYVLGMQNVLDVVGATNAKAKALKPEDLVDSRYVKQLDDEGFFKKLYGK